MNKWRIAGGTALAVVAWTMTASLVYCLGFSYFDIGLTFQHYQFPYWQWFVAVSWWDEATDRVRFWILTGAAVPTALGIMLAFRLLMPQRLRARRPF